jgi:hypothetical protein
MSIALFVILSLLSISLSSSSNDLEPTPRPARGDILDDTFQDQVREPIPRGLPGEGRRRNDLDQSRSLGSSSASLDSHFAALPEDKHAPLQSGDARAPFHFHDEQDAVTLSERAYDRVLLDFFVATDKTDDQNSQETNKDDDISSLIDGKNESKGNSERRLSEDSGTEENAQPEEDTPAPQLTNEHLREWALLSLNPDLAQLSEAEMTVFDASFAAFIKRQGFAPPAKVFIPKGFVAGWSATTWLQDVAEELKIERMREIEMRRRREEVIHNEITHTEDIVVSIDGDAVVDNDRDRRLEEERFLETYFDKTTMPIIEDSSSDLLEDGVVDSLGI